VHPSASGPLEQQPPVSGIAGIVHFSGDPPEREQVQQLSAGVAHRGPDDKGLAALGPALFAHRRLQGLPGEQAQPVRVPGLMLAIDLRLWEGDLSRFVEAWQQSGAACLHDVDADHALAAWDDQDRVLWLARDPLGTRPLYFARQGRKVAFASEIDPLLGLPWTSRRLATDNLAEYLSFRYVHAPRTMYQDISAVPPGHVVRIDATGVQVQRWWRPEWSPALGWDDPDQAEIAQRIDTSLQRSVARRVRAGGPVGLLLSGGVDSSAILFHASKVSPGLPTFTVGFADDGSDESPFAVRVANVLGAPNHLLRIDSQGFIDALRGCGGAIGQPLPTAATALQLLLLREARQHVRAVLSGDGGDEVLGGRGMESIAARLRKARLMGNLPPGARQVGRRLAGAAGLRDLAAASAQFGLQRTIGGARVFKSHERVALMRDPAMVRPNIRRALLEPLYQEVDTDPLNAILHVWQRGWLPEDSLLRSDRMAALAGIEVRYPMLDRALVSAANLLAGPVKVRRSGLGYTTKAPLRRAMAGRLPDQLINRPKRSMPSPLDQWLRGAGASFLREQVDAICHSPEGVFVPAAVRGLADEHSSGTRNNGLKLWTLVLYQLWRQGA
jgi:asparagine synthase (glutamine-hydrolysing)